MRRIYHRDPGFGTIGKRVSSLKARALVWKERNEMAKGIASLSLVEKRRNRDDDIKLKTCRETVKAPDNEKERAVALSALETAGLTISSRMLNKMMNLEIGRIDERLAILSKSKGLLYLSKAIDIASLWGACVGLAVAGKALDSAIGGGITGSLAYPLVFSTPFLLSSLVIRPAKRLMGFEMQRKSLGPNLPTFLGAMEISDTLGIAGLAAGTTFLAGEFSDTTATPLGAMAAVAFGTAVGTAALWPTFGILWKIAVRRNRDENCGIFRGAYEFGKGFVDGFRSTWRGKRVEVEELNTTYREAGFYAGVMESLFILIQGLRLPIVAYLASTGQITPDNIVGPMFVAVAKALGPAPGLIFVVQLQKIEKYLAGHY
ncbi:MAG: hypothetical protein ABII71_02015 [Candidatus Micrarchaeota archaeon]